MRMVMVGFSRPKNKLFPVFSYLIRWALGTPYSHVFVKWNSAWANRDFIYEASGTSVHFKGRIQFEKYMDVIKYYCLEVSDEAYRNLVVWCVDNNGNKYGFLQVWGIGLVAVVKKLFNKNIRNPFGRGSSYQVCSEMVARLLSDALNIKVDIDLDLVSPKDIDDYLFKLDLPKKVLKQF